MANAIQRANFYDYLAIVNADAVQRTSWWDYLPREIQIYIIQLAIRQRHRDQLQDVHQVLEKLWNICRCGPYHMLMELQFCRRRKWPISIGMRKLLNMQGFRGKEKNWKKAIRCRKDEEDDSEDED